MQGNGMAPQEQVHDHNTLEVCASACHTAALPVAALDYGNHCYCGNMGDVAKMSARTKPMEECQKTSCKADKHEKCGGKGRLLAYNYTC